MSHNLKTQLIEANSINPTIEIYLNNEIMNSMRKN